MRIIIVSDTHLADRAEAFGENWGVVRKAIERDPPDLVVHLGDVSAEGAGTPADLAEAAAHFENLPCPIRFLPGNHDIGDNPLDSGPSREDPPDAIRLERYRALYGDDRWSIAAGDWRLIGLNAQLLNTKSDEEEAQFAWLARELEGVRGPLGLMLHKPLFRDGPQDTQAHVRYVPASVRRRLLAFLAQKDLRFVVSGHVHQAREITVAGVAHVWAPATSCCMPDAMQERVGAKRLGILELGLTHDAFAFREIAPEGLVLHNLVDFAGVYPELAAVKARLGERAAL